MGSAGLLEGSLLILHCFLAKGTGHSKCVVIVCCSLFSAVYANSFLSWAVLVCVIVTVAVGTYDDIRGGTFFGAVRVEGVADVACSYCGCCYVLDVWWRNSLVT